MKCTEGRHEFSPLTLCEIGRMVYYFKEPILCQCMRERTEALEKIIDFKKCGDVAREMEEFLNPVNATPAVTSWPEDGTAYNPFEALVIAAMDQHQILKIQQTDSTVMNADEKHKAINEICAHHGWPKCVESKHIDPNEHPLLRRARERREDEK